MARRQAVWRRELVPSILREAEGTTRLGLQMKSKSGCFRAVNPDSSAASLFPPGSFHCRAVPVASEPWRGVQMDKLMSVIDAGRCREVRWPPDLGAGQP